MKAPAEGEAAPDFTLDSDSGGSITLSGLRGSKVVLYFYPRDDTPGCTVQACDFRDALPRFDGVGAVVLGVSTDNVVSHGAFRAKYDLNFPLLADVEGSVCDAYAVRAGGRIQRSTFLIDQEGVIQRVWRGVSAQGHADMLAEALGA
ncbi:MAG: peroxiredoxin [Gemmatimonadetes bacterium]|nr:peroxiredoxin [Gemmatimonadota bacterium]